MEFVDDQIAFGSSEDARDTELLKENKITALLNVAEDLNLDVQNYLLEQKVGLVAGHGNSMETFEKAVLIGKLMAENSQKVMVYCHEGRDRSPLVAIAIVSLLEAVPFGDKYQEVSGKSNGHIAFASDEAEEALLVLAESWDKNKDFREKLAKLELI